MRRSEGVEVNTAVPPSVGGNALNIVTVFRLVQPLNALLPINVTLLGMVMLSKPVQF